MHPTLEPSLDPARLLSAARSQRLLTGVRDDIEALVSEPPIDVASIDRVLGPRAGVRFETQLEKRRRGEVFVAEQSYDGTIATRGVVPTRSGSLHDLMNALAWAAFPRSKRAIHARQFAAFRAEVPDGETRLPGRRSRLRDRLAMLDEGGVLVSSTDPAVEIALDAVDRDALFDLRARGAFTTQVLGHAILEHAVSRPDVEVRGCVVLLPAAPSDGALTERVENLGDAELERWIARHPSLPVEWLL